MAGDPQCAASSHELNAELAGSQQAAAVRHLLRGATRHADEPVQGLAARVCFIADPAVVPALPLPPFAGAGGSTFPASSAKWMAGCG